jgi:hypothetical protein
LTAVPGGSHSWLMRLGVVLSALLVLAGCIPHGEPRTPPPRPQQSRSEPDDGTMRVCRSALAREGVRFRELEDRRFEHGCSAVGAVQLLEIGTPVTNLGAMTCPLARAFARWVRDSVQPAAQQRLGSPVRRVESFGTYACRSVNSQAGARLSEHAFANAVDIAAFVLADGRRITVEQGWRNGSEAERRFLRQIHQEGCRIFNIGLGPDSDAFHYNHLHFDLGRGPYCR